MRRVKILVIGSGGREHALVWRLAKSGHELLAAPGNPGMAQLARCFPIGIDRHGELVALARERRVELVVVGPEGPLVAGLAGGLRAAGSATVGASAAVAQLEGSKAGSKQCFARHNIPTAKVFFAKTVAEADAAIEQ